MTVNQRLDYLVNKLLPDLNDEFNNHYLEHSLESVDQAMKQLSRIKYEIVKIQTLSKGED